MIFLMQVKPIKFDRIQVKNHHNPERAEWFLSFRIGRCHLLIERILGHFCFVRLMEDSTIDLRVKNSFNE